VNKCLDLTPTTTVDNLKSEYNR